jgi:hypothetical protein
MAQSRPSDLGKETMMTSLQTSDALHLRGAPRQSRRKKNRDRTLNWVLPLVILLTGVPAEQSRAMAILASPMVPSDDALLQFARTAWMVPAQYSDAAVKNTFDATHYGIDWRVWLSAFVGMQDSVAALNRGDYPTAWQIGKQNVQLDLLQEIIDKSVAHVITAPALVEWATDAVDVGGNFLELSLEVDALAYQQQLYFQARPFNSAAQIANLAPFDLLDGVDMTKEGKGWLFQVSTYLRPFPSGMDPQQFWPLAESEWGLSLITPAEAAAENATFSALFQADISAVPEPSMLIAALAIGALFARRVFRK